jgi:hypothetical protein
LTVESGEWQQDTIVPDHAEHEVIAARCGIRGPRSGVRGLRARRRRRRCLPRASGVQSRCTRDDDEPGKQDENPNHEQLVARERLGEKVVRELQIGAARIARDAEQLQGLASRAQLPREIGAAHERHPHIGQHQVDRVPVLFEQLHGFVAVAGLVNPIARPHQRLREQLPDRRLVFDQEDRFVGSVAAHNLTPRISPGRLRGREAIETTDLENGATEPTK